MRMKTVWTVSVWMPQKSEDAANVTGRRSIGTDTIIDDMEVEVEIVSATRRKALTLTDIKDHGAID